MSLAKDVKKVSTTIEGMGEKVQKLQDEIVSLTQEREKLEFAPVSPDEAEELARRYINQQRDRAADKFEALASAIARRREVNLYNSLFASLVSLGEGTGRPTHADVVPLLAVVLGDAFADKLVELARAEAETNGGLNDDARGSRLQKINAQLDELERSEEAMITELEAQGVYQYPRRADCRPELVLGLA